MSERPVDRAWRKDRGVIIDTRNLDIPRASQRSTVEPVVSAIDEIIEALVENATLDPQHPGSLGRDGLSVSLRINPRKCAWEIEEPIIEAWLRYLNRDLIFGDNSGGTPPATRRRWWNPAKLGKAILKLIFKSLDD